MGGVVHECSRSSSSDCMAISVARANTEANPSSCTSARNAFDAETSTANTTSVPSTSAVPRAHARADDLGRQQAALGESLEHADVREALHAAAAEDETEACAAVHETAACPEGERSSNVVVAPMPALLIRRRVVRSRWTMAGLAVVVTLGLVALAAPWLAPGDAYRGALSVGLRPPSSGYLFGTDAQGRDVLSRGLFGG